MRTNSERNNQNPECERQGYYFRPSKTLEVTNKDMMIALQEAMDMIVDAVKNTIEKAPPEIAADIAENGMMLSGGGANIYNLDRLIKKKTDMDVSHSREFI